MEKILLTILAVNLIANGLWGFFGKAGVSRIGIYEYLLVVNFFMVSTIYGYLLLNGKLTFHLSKDLIYPILGGISVGIGSITFYKLLEESQASIIVPLTALYPAITVILAILILQEKITLIKGVGILLALIAGILLVL